MVDRRARDQAALLLRRFLGCRLTNDDFEDAFPDSADPVVEAVRGQAWCLYTDLYEHKLNGEHALDPETSRDVLQWIVFLHDDRPYEWPRFNFFQIYNWPFNLLTLGWWERCKARRNKEFMASGDFNVWPFLHREDLERSRRAPRLLSGRGRAA